MIRQAYRGLASFARRDVVLTIAILLAVLSAFFVPPSPAYLSYIDWDTLCLLFSLMAVMKGFQQEGFFQSMGSALLRRAGSTRRMVLVLVFLPFFCSMAITNDVSLITFVPFGLAVLKLAQQEELAVPLVALQTLAANLGSMLTPMGNPQNLYLYSRSGMGFGELCAVMLPYVLLSGICLLGLSVLRPSHPNAPPRVNTRRTNPRRLGMWGVWFLLCLLGLFGAVPSWAVAALVLIFLFLRERPVLRAVDYSLLGTFAAFFLFIGNLSAIPWFQQLLSSVLQGREVLVSVLVSQAVSNVPAALLLSGFTEDWTGLLIGCNLGGLGTLIASMASLISYKQVSREYPQQRGKYLLWFTASNAGMLLLLLLEHQALRALF